MIDTPMVQITEKEHMISLTPMGREGKAEEVAELICWLLCDGSSFVTGTVQVVDGGYTR
jgi:NAD(P)-dependent dehydrogenase (short-subunit alcohol dehydrogenase family)